MRNRAKCKLCKSIVESLHMNDYVDCKCGEISVNGGDFTFGCSAKDWNNFLRIDDDDKEIPVTVMKPEEIGTEIAEVSSEPPTKDELLSMLDEMIASIDKLPDNAKYSSVNQYDLYTALLLISAIMKKM